MRRLRTRPFFTPFGGRSRFWTVLFCVGCILGASQSLPVVGIGTVGSAAAAPACGSWNLASDFLAHPTINPLPDSCGDPNVWSLLQSASLAHDGNYSPLTTSLKDFQGGIGLQGFGGTNPSSCGTGSTFLPFAVVNTSSLMASGCGTWQVPSHVVDLHPWPTQMAMVGWTSPITGTVLIAGGVADLDSACGDGIRWFIDHGTTNVAAGSFANGGNQAFPSNLSVSVNAGELIYFATDPGPNGDHICDSTRLAVTISTSSTAGYVALGDSYSAGEGVYTQDSSVDSGALAQALYASGTNSPDYLRGTDAPGNQCHRSVTSGYPRLFAGIVGLSFSDDRFWACSGSIVSDLCKVTRALPPTGLACEDFINPNVSNPNHQWGQAPDDHSQVSHLGSDTTLVTLTVGGNDAGFVTVLNTCFHPRLLSACFSNGLDGQVSQDIARLRISLRDTLYAIQIAAPQARILVADYPQLFNPDGSGGFSSGCGALTLVEKLWLNAKTAQLDGVIRDVVKNSGVAEFVEAINLLGTANGQHQVCGSNDPWINGIVADPSRGIATGGPYGASFHPNDGGYHAYALRFAFVYHFRLKFGTKYTIRQSQTIAVRVKVPASAVTMNFGTRWGGSDVTLSLTSPSGRIINRTTVTRGTFHVAGPTFEHYTVTNPQSGTWTVHLFGNQIAPGGEQVTLVARPGIRSPTPPHARFTVHQRVRQRDRRGLRRRVPGGYVFNAHASTAGSLRIRSYTWFFGDGKKASGRTAQHDYHRAGTFTPVLMVTYTGRVRSFFVGRRIVLKCPHRRCR